MSWHAVGGVTLTTWERTDGVVIVGEVWRGKTTWRFRVVVDDREWRGRGDCATQHLAKQRAIRRMMVLFNTYRRT